MTMSGTKNLAVEAEAGLAAFRSRDLAVVAAITVIGLIARVYKLDAGLWFDEVLTLADYVRLSAFEIMTTYGSLNNHIFYSLQAHVSVALFGESAWALRLPAMLFGVAAIPLFWLLVMRVSHSVGMAHASAALLALNYHHIWFSQNARGYTGLVFWSLLALLLLIEARRAPRPALWIGIAVAGGLAMYTHLSAAFFLSGLFLAFVIVELVNPTDGPFARRFGVPVLAFAGAGLAALVLHAPVLPDILRNVSEIAGSGQEDTAVDALAEWKNPLSALVTALEHLSFPMPVVMVVAPVAGILGILAWIRLARWNGLFAVTIPATVLTTVVCLQIAGMRIWPRFFLTDVVLMLAVAAAAVVVIAEFIAKGRTAERLKILGWSLGIAVSAVWAVQNYRAPKQDFVGAVAFVEREAQPGDVRASLGLATHSISTYFAPDWTSVADVSELESLLQEPGGLWLLYVFPEITRAHHPEVVEFLERRLELAAEFTGTLGGGGAIHVWRER